MRLHFLGLTIRALSPAKRAIPAPFNLRNIKNRLMDILRTLRPFSNLGRIWHARWLGHFSPMQILIKPLFIESVIIGALKIKSYQVARPIF